MPNSLTKVLPFALVFSTRLPVSVYGTVSRFHRSFDFSRFLVRPTSGPEARHHGCYPLATFFQPKAGGPSNGRATPTTGTGILTCCPSPTLFSLGLGPTNPTRTGLPSETLDFRRIWFSHISRYSCQHSHFQSLQHPFRDIFSATGTPLYHTCVSLASVVCLAPLHCPRNCV